MLFYKQERILIMGLTNVKELNQTEYRVYIQQYANSKEELFTFQNKEAAMKLYDEVSKTSYHTHIEYYLDGKFQYNVCGSCKQEYIHNPEEELNR